jgi:hypothetical protein
VLPPLLTSLAEPSENKDHSLQDQQALAKQLALLFDFTLQFDQTRMMRPHLSNDFSYYRRLLPKFPKRADVMYVSFSASFGSCTETSYLLLFLGCGSAFEKTKLTKWLCSLLSIFL